MTSISSIPSSNSGNSILSAGGSSFGNNPFLELLTAQLKNQTPLEPVDNTAFMQQMASYSSMTQQQDLNTNMLKLLDYQGLLARMQGLSEGSALLGKEVTYDTETAKNQKDKVESIYIGDDGDVRMRLAGGNEIAMRQVTGIANPVAAA